MKNTSVSDTVLQYALEVVPHSGQRYKTIGDWYESLGGVTVVRSSRLSDWRYEFLILVHELIECGLCRNANISQLEVDTFDNAHENEQDEVELGDLKEAPYRKQHCLATAVERMLAAELGVCWSEYEEELAKLME